MPISFLGHTIQMQIFQKMGDRREELTDKVLKNLTTQIGITYTRTTTRGHLVCHRTTVTIETNYTSQGHGTPCVVSCFSDNTFLTRKFSVTLPRLRVAAAVSRWRVAVEYFRNLAEAALVQDFFRTAQISFCRRDRFRRKIPRTRQRLAKNRERPRPRRAVVIGGLAARVLVALVMRPIRFRRVVDKPSIIARRPAAERKPAVAQATATRRARRGYFCAAATQHFARSPVTRPRLTAKRTNCCAVHCPARRHGR